MIGLLILLFALADFASLYVLWLALQPAYNLWIAGGLVVLYVLFAMAVGGWVIRAGGMMAGVHALRAVQRGASPTRDLLNGLLAFVAGLLVIFPGLLSDAVALLLLLPPTRALVRRALFGPLKRRATRPPGDDAVDVDYRIE